MKMFRYLVCVAVASVVVSTGCSSSTGRSASPSVARMETGMSMTPGGGSAPHLAAKPGPSPSARMVCSPEIRHSVGQALALPALAAGTATWVDALYTCTYQTPAGPVVLSVKDSASLAAGQSFFDATRQRLAPRRLLVGLAAFGLPAFETPSGRVVFLKDGKTLDVDATGLTSLPAQQQSRTDVAYAIAADVIGCWSE